MSEDTLQKVPCRCDDAPGVPSGFGFAIGLGISLGAVVLSLVVLDLGGGLGLSVLVWCLVGLLGQTRGPNGRSANV